MEVGVVAELERNPAFQPSQVTPLPFPPDRNRRRRTQALLVSGNQTTNLPADQRDHDTGGLLQGKSVSVNVEGGDQTGAFPDRQDS